ncbi:MAG: cation-transporting P-type ATPase [Patescibacteria group bacterium]|jgi:Ca2+-transporting ATPase
MEGLGVKHRFLIEDKIDQVFDFLRTSSDGLTEYEADKRLQGLKIREAKQNQLFFWLKLFLSQFKSALVFLLFIGAIFSFIVDEKSQGWVILTVVLINAIIGSVQEYRAESALAEFKKLIPQYSRVRRKGGIATIRSKNIVLGDILLISAGDMVPVDARLIKASSLKLNESALTGEFESKIKYAGELKHSNRPIAELDNCVFAGTSVVEGDAEAVVIAVGEQTVIGQVADLVLAAKPPKTPLEKQIDQISRFSAVSGLIIGLVILLLSIYSERSITQTMLLVISSMVAIVPEGLTSAVSVTLAVGSMRLVKKQAIVRRLPIVQTLGSVTVICTDKTGTLTNNQLELSETKMLNQSKQSSEWYNAIIACCNSAVISTKGVIGDQVDVALYQSMNRKVFNLERKRFTEIAQLPFDSVRKRMSVIVEDAERNIWCLTKGAPNGLLSQFNERVQDQIEQTMDEWSEKGKKIIILAMRQISKDEWKKFQPNPENFDAEIENHLHPIALVSLTDAPKTGIDRSIAISKDANVRTIMITGDWSKTAISIGKQIGLYTDDPKIITGSELMHLSVNQLRRMLKNPEPVLFSEIDPRQKQKIVQALQSNYEVVGMTGDGVNDAPALRQADIGIAMGKYGTDIARESAGMVLKDDSYSTIVESIKEGRIIFNNIRKFVFYEFATVAVQILVVIFGLMLGLPPVLLPVQIIILDFMIGLMPSLALGVDGSEPDIMRHHPSRYNQVLIASVTIWRILRNGGVAACGAILSYYVILFQNGWRFNSDMAISHEMATMASSAAFLALALFMISFALHSRSETQTLMQLTKKPNNKLLLAMLGSFVITLLVIYLPFFNQVLNTRPLSIIGWIAPVLSAIVVMIGEDLFKKRQISLGK